MVQLSGAGQEDGVHVGAWCLVVVLCSVPTGYIFLFAQQDASSTY